MLKKKFDFITLIPKKVLRLEKEGKSKFLKACRHCTTACLQIGLDLRLPIDAASSLEGAGNVY